MRENNLPGNTPATMNSTKTMSIGTHRVSNVKSEDNCTESKSSIRSLVLKIIKRATITEINTTIPVSKRNILKMLIALAPLHLCTPMLYALRLMVAIATNT